VDGAGSEFFIDTKNRRYSTKLLTTASGGYITAERYNEIVEQEKIRYENWKKSKSPKCVETCPDCKGSGATYSKPSDFPCAVCGGSGINGYTKSTMEGYTKIYTTFSPNICWKCNGTGKGEKTSYLERCYRCYGAGCLKYE
jgi:DnaJ-class molecular chaperone